MKIETLSLGPFETNCYILSNGKEAVIIDPASEPETIIQHLQKHKLTPVSYLCTHGHMDHIFALADLYAQWPAPIGMHAKDLEWAFTEHNIMPPFFPDIPDRPPEIARLLEHGQEWTSAGLSYQVLGTPGHSPGSVCFHFPGHNILISGDTLFAGSVGRTDFHGGNSRRLQESLALLKKLPDNTLVYPGHGSVTDIGREKKTNYFMQGI